MWYRLLSGALIVALLLGSPALALGVCAEACEVESLPSGDVSLPAPDDSGIDTAELPPCHAAMGATATPVQSIDPEPTEANPGQQAGDCCDDQPGTASVSCCNLDQAVDPEALIVSVDRDGVELLPAASRFSLPGDPSRRPRGEARDGPRSPARPLFTLHSILLI